MDDVNQYRQPDGTYLVPVGMDLPPIRYREVNGAFYHAQTDPALIAVLEGVRRNRARIRVTLGDVVTGRPWGDRPEEGYLDTSRGPIRVLLLMARSHSDAGGGLLDHCVVKVEYANKRDGAILWEIRAAPAG
jgi:hypothetical protein